MIFFRKHIVKMEKLLNKLEKLNINIDYIIKIQKYFRYYLYYKKYILLPSSYYQTKIWRKNQKWYKNGKYNECEKYQIKLMEKIIKNKLNKTDERINLENIEITNNKSPLNQNDGFEWTENFDGKIEFNNNIYYFNFKFVCDSGGAQTRSLREVYHFIKFQYKYLQKNNSKNIYFINILDGDNCYKNIHKFYYLLNKFNDFQKYVFIGDLYQFQINKFKYYFN